MRTAALLLALSAAGTANAVCRLEVGELSLGAIDLASHRPVEVVGTVRWRCDGPIGTLQIALLRDAGSHKLQHGGDSLAYEIFLDAGHTIAWGDGTAGTQAAIVSGSSGVLPIYGRVPAGQRARPGAYLDQLVVTFSY